MPLKSEILLQFFPLSDHSDISTHSQWVNDIVPELPTLIPFLTKFLQALYSYIKGNVLCKLIDDIENKEFVELQRGTAQQKICSSITLFFQPHNKLKVIFLCPKLKIN